MSNSLGNYASNSQHVVKGSEVFIGGLARTVTEDKLTEVFSTCGEILEIRLIKDHNGSLKGFGFIRFSTKAGADKAVKEKSGLMLDGKQIGVLPSSEQDTLFFGNLYKGWSAEEFNMLVRQVFPDIVSVDLAMPSGSGETPSQKKQNRGFAFVKFSSHAAASRSLRVALSPEFLLGGKLHPAVDWAENAPEVDPEELAQIKIAFLRNLPAEADENFLRILFTPLGKVEKAVLSKKARNTVGFVHFANRSELDDAIKVLNGKTVQGPNGGPPFKIQVEVARPMDKNKKRAREDPLSSKQYSSHPKLVKTELAGLKVPAQQVQEPVAADPYEAAVVLLPVAVKERLLRILRLGIATRFDIDRESLTSLRELPESTAISILDQFMLSGADKLNKGAYLSGLISRHQVDKQGLYGLPSSLSRARDIPIKEPEQIIFSSRANVPAFDSISSHLGLTARSDGLASRYSSIYSDYPLSSRATFGRLQEPIPAHLQQISSAALSPKVGSLSHLPAAVDRRPARPQIRFDPFTGEPYKFDPFTGEPIRPESPPTY